jgi:hypothetical protein
MGDRITRRPDGESLSIQENAAAKYRLDAEYRLRQGRPASSDQTCKT